MRQPEQLPPLAPSSVPLWYGYAPNGERFTFQQIAAMSAEGIDPDTADVLACRRAATDREYYIPIGQMPPVFEFDCPILSCGRMGKVRVISPSGLPAWVTADGWVGKPAKRRERGWMW